MELDDQMKALIRDLGLALHRALTKNEEVQSITDQIKRNGYDIYLIMEANIALDRRENNEMGELILGTPEDHKNMAEFTFNAYDQDFLADLQIKADDD